MKMDKTYRTKDLALAAFLYVSNKKLSGLEEDNGKFLFVFNGKADCEKLTDAFWRKEAMVNAREFCDSLRTMKDLIFNRERRG